MASERIFSQFLGSGLSGLAWFRAYQTQDIKMLEEIIRQGEEQYQNIPEEEQRWLDKLKAFNDDFKSFDWTEYNSLRNNREQELKYEMETGIRWARQIKDIIDGYWQFYDAKSLENLACYDPLVQLLSNAGTRYEKAETGIYRQVVDDKETD